jgi:hypothetical protein
MASGEKRHSSAELVHPLSDALAVQLGAARIWMGRIAPVTDDNMAAVPIVEISIPTSGKPLSPTHAEHSSPKAFAVASTRPRNSRAHPA